jgi:alkylhydroperoxidase family enzyme
MPRISYQPLDLAEPADLVASIRQRRSGTLLNLDRMLLHSPAFARGWNAHLGQVRSSLALDPKLRELAICMVAVLNRADYEFAHHGPEFLHAGGTQAQLDALRRLGTAAAGSDLFDATERDVLALTCEMTERVDVSDETFDRVRRTLKDDRLVVELVGVVATYNMVSRFLVALGIAPEEHESRKDAA